MLVRVRSATVLGVTAIPVDVEVDAAQGMPNTRVVGLPGTGVQESRVRVAAAIRNLGVKLPSKRWTVYGLDSPAARDNRSSSVAEEAPRFVT